MASAGKDFSRPAVRLFQGEGNFHHDRRERYRHRGESCPSLLDLAADVLAEFEPPVVSFHFGLPSADLLARVRRWGAKVLASATTVAGSV